MLSQRRCDKPNLMVWALIMMMGAGWGCGAKNTVLPNSGGSSFSSTAPRGDTGSSTTGTLVGAECNQFAASGSHLDGRIKPYYDSNGNIQESMLRLRFTQVDSQFEANSNSKIQFFVWDADSAGTTNLNQTPLTFRIELVYGGIGQSLSGYINGLTKADLESMKNNAGYSTTTMQDFLQKIDFVLTGTDYNWDALKIALYVDANLAIQTDALMPIFAANPNKYALSHSNVLNQLHPFWNNKSNTSDQYYANLAKGYCF